MKVVTKDQVEKALTSLEAQLAGDGDESVVKASDDDLDQPEGGDLGNPVKEKMSDAAKSKKKVAKAEDEGDEGEDDGDEDDMKKKNPFAKKSFTEGLPEEIETKIDVSDFLKSLVNHTGECIDGLTEFVAKSDKAAASRYAGLNEAVEEIQKSQAKIGVVLKAICQRIGVIEAAPARVAKSDTVVKSTTQAPAADRQFASGLETEATEDKMFKSLSNNPIVAKSQLAAALCDLVRKGEAQDLDVIGFESGGFIRPELVSKLKTVLN